MNKFEDVERFDPEIMWEYNTVYAVMQPWALGGYYVSYEDYKELLNAYKALVEKQEEN